MYIVTYVHSPKHTVVYVLTRPRSGTHAVFITCTPHALLAHIANAPGTAAARAPSRSVLLPPWTIDLAVVLRLYRTSESRQVAAWPAGYQVGDGCDIPAGSDIVLAGLEWDEMK